jgi:hypothetical protein
MWLLLPLFRNMKYSLVIIGLVLQAIMLPTTLAVGGVRGVGVKEAKIESGGRMELVERDLGKKKKAKKVTKAKKAKKAKAAKKARAAPAP